jgi:hypothetical protein
MASTVAAGSLYLIICLERLGVMGKVKLALEAGNTTDPEKHVARKL